jgi:hypothetical protein
MDILNLVTAVAAYVQEKQLPVNQYIIAPDRQAIHLPDHVESMEQLLHHLADTVLGRIPLSAYASHYYSTLKLIESLQSLEEGFSSNVQANTLAGVNRHDIPRQAVEEMMKAKLTDRQIGQSFGVKPKTIYRRRLELGIHRRAAMKGTPDEVLVEVQSRMV